MNKRNFHKNQTGLTFIELLIAMALSGILMAGLFRVFEANRTTLALTESMSQAQEAGRFALEVLSRDIRMAAYGGCVNSDTRVDNFVDEADAEFDAGKHRFATGISVIDSYDPLVGPASIGGVVPLTGSDVFFTSGAVVTDLLVSKSSATSGTSMQVSGPAGQLAMLVKGEVILVTDCSNASVFSISKTVAGTTLGVFHEKVVSGGPDNTDFNLNYSYENGSTVLMITNASYFVAPTSWAEGNSLYRFSSVEGGAAVELMPFIESVVFTYGVDTDNNDNSVDRYVSGDELNNLAYQEAYDPAYQEEYDKQIAAGASEEDAKTAAEQYADGIGDAAAAAADITDYLVSVRIQIITRSQQSVGANQLDGFPDDGHLRKRFTRVIFVRNAGIGNDS